MLDTHARKYVMPFIDLGAKSFLKVGMNADNVTILAFIIGIISTVFIYFDHLVMAVLLLWISGFLDAVDGTMTRMQGNSTPIGTLMDITFDRIVELSIIITLAIKFDHTRLDMLILVSCILISMTIFLTVGALSKVKGVKSFYYQAGLAERSEGFIMLSLMILFPSYLAFITRIFYIMILITATQRALEAKRMFSSEEDRKEEG